MNVPLLRHTAQSLMSCGVDLPLLRHTAQSLSSCDVDLPLLRHTAHGMNLCVARNNSCQLQRTVVIIKGKLHVAVNSKVSTGKIQNHIFL